MDGFDSRKKGFENKFALEEEQEFKAKAMASKMFGIWAAEEMLLSEEKAQEYGMKLVELSIKSKDSQAIIDLVQKDLTDSKLSYSNMQLEHILQEKFEICKNKILAS